MKRLLEEELIAWKNRKGHLPLLLRGARQVGKSYLVEHFGKTHFKKLIVIDFERRPEFKRCFQTREPTLIIQQIELLTQETVIIGDTLLFFDEIQECEEALVALRYFKELMPDLHIIAAGSLMEFLLNDERYSFPVGRVEFLYLRPLCFREFLIAVAPIAAKRIEENHTFQSAEHEEMLKWVRIYLFVGGMPAAVDAYIQHRSFLECQRVHNRILQAYESDFGKYASQAQHKYLRLIFQKAPLLIAKILKYTQIDRETRSRELKPALDLLVNAGLLHKVYATTASGLPLHAHLKEHRFKLLFLDVGLLQTALGVDAQGFWENEILQINEGALAEQFVGSELLAAQRFDQNKPLLFWEKEEGGAEIDFVTTVHSKIVPIEVKSGSSGKLRSLHSFLLLKQLSFGVRISEVGLAKHDHILSIPLYLASSLEKFL